MTADLKPSLLDIHSLWIGDELGPLEQICLASFVRHGHRVFLHSYRDFPLPDGVKPIDARMLAPFDARLRYRRSGSVALFADYYRARILQEYDACWADADIFCIHPLEAAPSYIIDFHTEPSGRRVYQNAVLRAPRHSALLSGIVELFDDYRHAYRFVSPRRRLKYRLQSLIQRNFGLADMPWGLTGPIALAHLCRELGLDDDIDRLGPIISGAGPRLFEPQGIDSTAALGGLVAHFVHSQVPKDAPANPKPGSFYGACVREVGAMTPYFRARPHVIERLTVYR